MGELKNIRKEKKLTQQQAADLIGISLRSYKSYENDEDKSESIKYKYILQKLSEVNPIDEEHGILELADIKSKCSEVFERYEVDFCILFGSYAKGKAKPNSDVDLIISGDVHGLKFYALVEEIRITLHKRVDLLDVSQLNDNMELIKEVLRDGIRIYG